MHYNYIGEKVSCLKNGLDLEMKHSMYIKKYKMG